jgi:hypothetical protein
MSNFFSFIIFAAEGMAILLVILFSSSIYLTIQPRA